MYAYDVPLSVVIATLGGEALCSTIARLNQGTVVPREILICIPEEYLVNIAGYTFPINVSIVPTNFKGQVAQRAFGFSRVSCEYVLQLDDDILVEKDCIELLLSALVANGDFIATGPDMIDIVSGQSVFRKRTRHSNISRLYYWLNNGSAGYSPGAIYISGAGDGYDPEQSNELEPQPVEWLSGGCVLHKKSNLILENYFKFNGKAYCEDFIHSYLLRARGVSLFSVPKAKVYIDSYSYTELDFVGYIKWVIADWKARAYFNKLRDQKSVRIIFFYGFTLLNFLLKKIRKQKGGL